MILNPRTQAFRAETEEIVKDLQQLSQEIGHRELSAMVGELRNRMNDPFMFVIVGEVKAGKSSFVNALLEPVGTREICPVAPQPMTDTIQQIMYGDEEQIITVNPYLKKVLLPIEILREIAIVDTPGTNSIVERHQEITEKFIPASDLVIFVFEAKNPYRQSAWDFFEFIHRDWHKKIIFVLQQKDLLNQSDLEVNERGLFDYATKKGVESAQIFSLSAKQELEGEYDQSGFSTIRDFIRTHVTGGKGAALKIRNNVEIARQILARVKQDLDTRVAQYKADLAFRQDITHTLDHQAAKSNHQVRILIENLLNTYDRVTKNIWNELSYGLSFFSLLSRSFKGLFNRQSSIKDWFDELTKKLETNLNADLRTRLQEGVVDLADSVQQMAKMIQLKIKTSNTVVQNDSYIFEHIADRRSVVLKELQDDFNRFVSRAESFTDSRLFPEDAVVSPNIAGSTGIAVIGAVMLAVTNITVVDITGGVLTGLGLLFAGVTATTQRRKILNGYRDQIADGRAKLSETLETRLGQYVEQIKTRIGENFLDLDVLLEYEKQQISHFEEKFADLDKRLDKLNQNLH